MNQLQRDLLSVSSAYWYSRNKLISEFEQLKKDFVAEAETKRSTQFIWKICRYIDRVEAFALFAIAFDFPFSSGETPTEMRIQEDVKEIRTGETKRNEKLW
jgi:hypothetical protein